MSKEQKELEIEERNFYGQHEDYELEQRRMEHEDSKYELTKGDRDVMPDFRSP